MSEAMPEEPARARGGRLSQRTWLIALGVAVVAGAGWYLYRRNKASSTAATSGTAGSGTTADTVDYAGQLSVIQTELESLMAEEGTEPAAGTSGGTGTGTTTAQLAAPGSISVTPSARHADLSWSPVKDARVYQLLVQGASGRGTGTSHFEHVFAGTHASVSLGPGRYVARVRAGRSTADIHGRWSADHAFTVPRSGGVSHPGPVKPPGRPGEDGGPAE